MTENEEIISRLFQILEMCDIHLKRLKYARNNLDEIFLLDEKTYKSLSNSDITLIDQMVYRFTKLQDTMGSKLFPQTLKSLGEDYSDKPFLDILNRLEKLGLISDHKQWIMMSEVRNQLSHEYPSETEDIIDGLNSLFENVTTIGTIYLDLKTCLYSRFQE